MSYEELTDKFVSGDPVSYQSKLGYVIAMNDLNHTITVEVDGKPHTDVKYVEVKDYSS